MEQPSNIVKYQEQFQEIPQTISTEVPVSTPTTPTETEATEIPLSTPTTPPETEATEVPVSTVTAPPETATTGEFALEGYLLQQCSENTQY